MRGKAADREGGVAAAASDLAGQFARMVARIGAAVPVEGADARQAPSSQRDHGRVGGRRPMVAASGSTSFVLQAEVIRSREPQFHGSCSRSPTPSRVVAPKSFTRRSGSAPASVDALTSSRAWVTTTIWVRSLAAAMKSSRAPEEDQR